MKTRYFHFLLLLFVFACDNDSEQDKPVVSKDYIIVTPNLQLLADGQVADLTVEANCSWNIAKEEEWLTVTPMSGTGTQHVEVSAGQNLTGVSRMSVLSVRGGTAPERRVMVTQPSAAVTEDAKTLSVEPQSLVFEATKESRSFTISSNTSWTVTCPEWCTPSLASGAMNATVLVTAEENPEKTERSGYITVFGDNASPVSISISQKPKAEPEFHEPGSNDNQPPQ